MTESEYKEIEERILLLEISAIEMEFLLRRLRGTILETPKISEESKN